MAKRGQVESEVAWMVGRSEKIRTKKKTLQAVLRIRIRQIHMFLGLLDPDPSIIKQ
jgi:hypothetical protein